MHPVRTVHILVPISWSCFCGTRRQFLKTWHQQRIGERTNVQGFLAIFWLLNFLQKRCFSTLEFTRFEIIPLTILGCDQQNLENFRSDFKLSGHRLAHGFADGWSTVAQRYTNAQSTLLQAPSGTLLFYYKDIKQEIVHTLLLGGYGVSKKWAVMIDR